MKNLINLGEKKKIKIFINLSTISIYAQNKNATLKESSIKDTFSLLGRTKYIGENIIKNSKLNYINLRLPGVISKQNKTILDKTNHSIWTFVHFSHLVIIGKYMK